MKDFENLKKLIISLWKNIWNYDFEKFKDDYEKVFPMLDNFEEYIKKGLYTKEKTNINIEEKIKNLEEKSKFFEERIKSLEKTYPSSSQISYKEEIW